MHETTETATPRRWPWIVGVVAALIVGAGLGAAAVNGAADTSTEAEHAEAQALRDQITALEADLDAALAELNAAPAANEPVVDDEPESMDATHIGVGETVAITEDGRDAVELTISSVDVRTTPQRSYGDTPRNGHFVIFTVDLEGLASTTVYGGDFYVLTADGVRYDEGDGNSWDAIGDLDDLLGYVDLNAGERRSGVLVFDLPDEHGELAYAPNHRAGPIGVWAFDGAED